MMKRLGQVIYWTANLITVLWFWGVYSAGNLKTREDWIFVIAIGLVIWLPGRACRYVLSGD